MLSKSKAIIKFDIVIAYLRKEIAHHALTQGVQTAGDYQHGAHEYHWMTSQQIEGFLAKSKSKAASDLQMVADYLTSEDLKALQATIQDASNVKASRQTLRALKRTRKKVNDSIYAS